MIGKVLANPVLAAAVLAAALTAFAPASAPAAAPPAAPSFTHDVAWMKLPPQWVMGDISAVAVDRADNVWILQRPRTIPAERRDRAAPPVLQFDASGKFIRGWGGPGEGYDWPGNEHSLFVDDADRVWISGNLLTPGISDDMVLAFTAEGRFIRQIGKRGAGLGDQDTANLKAPADLYVDVAAKELFAADGYGHRRVIVFDAETGRFKRMWGAFGAPPSDGPLGPARPAVREPGEPPETGEGSREFRAVHAVELSRDGLVYVSDRDNARIQVFDRSGRYHTQAFVHRNWPNRQTASGIALSPDKDQRWLYVADFGNSALVVFDRKTLTEVATLGSRGREPAQFTGPHLIATDSKGDLYVAEVQGGRVHKLLIKP